MPGGRRELFAVGFALVLRLLLPLREFFVRQEGACSETRRTLHRDIRVGGHWPCRSGSPQGVFGGV